MIRRPLSPEESYNIWQRPGLLQIFNFFVPTADYPETQVSGCQTQSLFAHYAAIIISSDDTQLVCVNHKACVSYANIGGQSLLLTWLVIYVIIIIIIIRAVAILYLACGSS